MKVILIPLGTLLFMVFVIGPLVGNNEIANGVIYLTTTPEGVVVALKGIGLAIVGILVMLGAHCIRVRKDNEWSNGHNEQ
jgi:hypothetical protein